MASILTEYSSQHTALYLPATPYVHARNTSGLRVLSPRPSPPARDYPMIPSRRLALRLVFSCLWCESTNLSKANANLLPIPRAQLTWGAPLPGLCAG
jgi:hypothetical protein